MHKRKRVGIFGGTFDPVHCGHLRLAKQSLRSLGLDRIYFVPAGRSPSKSNDPSASAAHRLKMLRLALGKNPGFKISNIEIIRPGVSYTVDTLEWFLQKYPQSELYFIMGSDILGSLKRWKNWNRIAELCTIAAGKRRGSQPRIPHEVKRKVLILKSWLPDISSTEIRKAVRKGEGSSHLPPLVAAYIQKQGLYGAPAAD